MKPLLLSICIATYNRAGYIGETLNSIIPQLDDDVEVLIVDGASTDKTSEVVGDFVKKNQRIRYVRLPAKGGVDHDYNKAVELAEGEYFWLFTDDDLLKPGAIAAIKKTLSGGPDLIVVNAEVRNKKLSEVIESRRIKITEDRKFSSGEMDAFFVLAGDYLTFIGAIVMRRSIWLERERALYFGTDFIHIGVIFQRALSGSVIVIAEPYIAIRWGNAQWTPRGFEIWMFQWPELVWSLGGISSDAKQKVITREPWRSLESLLIYRAAGSYDIAVYRRHFRAVKAGYFWKIFATSAAITPRIILTPFFEMLRSIRRTIKNAFQSI